MFSVRDSKSNAFLQPFFSATIGSALRAFGDAVNDQNSPFGKHPEDYLLFELADFDDSTGLLVGCEPIKLLGSATDFVSARGPAVAFGSRQEVMNGTEKVG